MITEPLVQLPPQVIPRTLGERAARCPGADAVQQRGLEDSAEGAGAGWGGGNTFCLQYQDFTSN